jgi:hypothetical protein
MLGKKVRKSFGTILRFGTVISEKKENGWKYVVVDWIDDRIYEQATAWKNKMRATKNGAPCKDVGWYRIDEVEIIDAEAIVHTLRKLDIQALYFEKAGILRL